MTTLTDPEKVYTVVCPGGARFDENALKTMKAKGDKRAHGGGGWNVSKVPAKCPRVGTRPKYEVASPPSH